MQISDYIRNGKVKRSSIALDIASGKLSESDVETLINDSSIAAGFIGTEFSDKRPPSAWNADYLKNLSYTAVAGPFNGEYLRYLYAVAQYVNNKKSGNAMIKKIAIGTVIIILVVIAGIVIYHYRVTSIAGQSEHNYDLRKLCSETGGIRYEQYGRKKSSYTAKSFGKPWQDCIHP